MLGQLQQQFESLERMPSSRGGIAQRLAQFVLTGEGETAIAELSSINGAASVLQLGPTITMGLSMDYRRSTDWLKVLPQDPALYLRLARVYEAAWNPANGLNFQTSLGPPIPAFPATVQWLTLFLLEFSRSGTVEDPYLPARIVEQMLIKSNEDPLLLIRGAFFLLHFLEFVVCDCGHDSLLFEVRTSLKFSMF